MLDRSRQGKLGEVEPRLPLVRWIGLASLVVLAVVAVALVLWSQRPRLTITCIEGEAARSEESKTWQQSLEDQIIITGPQRGVSDTLDSLKREGIELTPIRTCDVSYSASRDLRSELLPLPAAALRSLRMGLYQLPEEQSLADVLNRTQDIGGQHGVYADANYLVGLLGQSSCGNPYEVVGSPYEVVGSPYEVVGSPYEVVGSPGGVALAAEDAAEVFWNQWAFRQIGAGPYLTHTLEMASLAATGAGVRIGVFDAVPFTEPDTLKAAEVGEIVKAPAPAIVEWQTEMGTKTELELLLSYVKLPPMSPDDPNKAQDIRDHGLFVAGLIHAVAPGSEIHLYRVLNEYGCGRLFAINEAIIRFVEEVANDRGKLDGAVINLSLGVHKPRTPLQDPVPSSAADSEDSAQSTNGSATDKELLELLAKDTIESLRTAISMAHGEQVVVVAAAGNDSYLSSRDGRVLSPHIPALYPSVIGVAASNAMRERSCFSNWGDVSAPGGDGGPNPELAVDYEELKCLDCAPTTDKCAQDCTEMCTDECAKMCAEGCAEMCADECVQECVDECATKQPSDCKDTVISLMHHAYQGYAHWMGTSFSAPLVSGLAALVIDAQVPKCSCGPRRVSPDQVFNAIRCGASTSDGVINVPTTLYRCLP